MGSLLSNDDSRSAQAIQPMLITMEDLQRAIGCRKTTAFAIVGRGEIETVQIGRKRMAVVESVHSYVENLRQAKRQAMNA